MCIRDRAIDSAWNGLRRDHSPVPGESLREHSVLPQARGVSPLRGPGAMPVEPVAAREVVAEEIQEGGFSSGHRMRAPSATVEVRVLTEREEPIPGVRLHLADANDEPRVTDGNGLARLRVPAGRKLVLEAEGRWVGVANSQRAIDAIEAGDTAEVQLMLDAAKRRTFHGRVVDAGTGAPLIGSDVRLLMGSPFGVGVDEQPLAESACAPDGSFHFFVAEYGRDVVRIEHPGHSPAYVQVTGAHASPDLSLIHI